MAGTRAVAATCAALALTVSAAGCGGSKTSYVYNLAVRGNSPVAKGIYLSVVSPIKIPASAFKGGRLVDHVSGPEACALSQVVKDPPARYAQFKGKKLTLKIYGATPFTKLICQLARKSGATMVFGR
jgi:hypothetical protein